MVLFGQSEHRNTELQIKNPVVLDGVFDLLPKN
jgi:hypothetical protein